MSKKIKSSTGPKNAGKGTKTVRVKGHTRTIVVDEPLKKGKPTTTGTGPKPATSKSAGPKPATNKSTIKRKGRKA